MARNRTSDVTGLAWYAVAASEFITRVCDMEEQGDVKLNGAQMFCEDETSAALNYYAARGRDARVAAVAALLPYGAHWRVANYASQEAMYEAMYEEATERFA